jgi:D-alanyl-D-alanine carboxypeptidase/D-alanyl-D-alanine-endopeptidase (penicillin-binding protein 4)
VSVRAAWSSVLLLAGCAGATGPTAPAPASPEGALAAIIDQGPLAGAQWGVLAVDMASGDTLLARNAATRFLPASTMKVATSIAALDLLGADYRWRTDLWSSGPIDSATATLRGDLVVPGTGDPTLSPRFYPDAPGPLELLASGLRDLGVTRVTGALVIDASRWDSTTVRNSWMVDDLPFDYGSTGGAFALNDGETWVEVRGADLPGRPATIRWWPYGEAGFVRSRLFSTSGRPLGVTASYLPESRVLELNGPVPAGAIDTLAFATRDPVRQAAAALYRAITESGVTIDGGWRVEWTPGVAYGNGCTTAASPPCPSGRLLRGLTSPPMTDVVAVDLGPSQNWTAEQMLRTIGAEKGARGSWDEGSAAAVRQLVTGAGIDSLDIRMVDGSGLSTQDLLTPRALVQMFRYARTRPWADAFRSALPEPGEPRTTLETRLTDLPGRVFAKTGTLTNVSALAGYVTDERGREIAFAILVNASNLPGATSRQAIDAIVRLLASRR